jgi:hypothetical protein
MKKNNLLKLNMFLIFFVFFFQIIIEYPHLIKVGKCFKQEKMKPNNKQK